MTDSDEIREWCNREYRNRTEEGRMDTWRSRVWEWVEASLPKNGVKSILDVGTGEGVVLGLLSDLTGATDCLGIDISDLQIERCRKRWVTDRLKFMRADFIELELNRKFDLVVCWSIFLHIPPDEVAKFAKKVVDAAGKYILLVHAQPDRPDVPDKMEWYHDEFDYFGDLKVVVSHDIEPAGPKLALRIYRVPQKKEAKDGKDKETAPG